MLSEMGINVVEAEENGGAEPKEADEATRRRRPRAPRSPKIAPSPRCGRAGPTRPPRSRPTAPTIPVRMYLREMGSVELLSREGEIAIAKRIEAGREAMIAGLCESPLTFQAIIIWRDELVEGRVLLRDIIDLEATYAGPDGKNGPPKKGRPERRGERPRRTRSKGHARRRTTSTTTTSRTTSRSRPWRPRSSRSVLEIFDNVAENYKKLRRLQVEHVEQRHAEQAADAGPGAQAQEAQGRRHHRRQVAAR